MQAIIKAPIILLCCILSFTCMAQNRTTYGTHEGKQFKSFIGGGSFSPHQYEFYSQDYEKEGPLVHYGLDYSIYNERFISSVFLSSTTELTLNDISPTRPDYRFQMVQLGLVSGFRADINKWLITGQLGVSVLYAQFTLIRDNINNNVTFENIQETSVDANAVIDLSLDYFFDYNRSIGVEFPVYINRRGSMFTPCITYSYYWL